MPFEHRKFITRAMLRAEREKLFVFGDNFARSGMGGQAAEMRGEPNAIGLITKRYPNNRAQDFLNDTDLNRVRQECMPDVIRILQYMMMDGQVVWPEAGIGTGRAALFRHAPRVADYWHSIHEILYHLGNTP